MELPFTGFELTFIIVAFIIFTLFSLASVCFQPQAARPGTHLASDITTETNVSLSNHKEVIIICNLWTICEIVVL
uniref:Small integral membrane protein 31 n=1 Tax=Maylandia zebra TaxID=106582 RepID=A0A3P9BMG3_9CICH